MLDMHKFNLAECKSVSLDWPWDTAEPTTSMWAHESSGSGGYSDHIFRYAAKELFDIDVVEMEYKNLRNPDFREVILEKDGKLLLRFAVANGFRNIQNLVQKLKRGKSSYHYVEVMACPSGVYAKFVKFIDRVGNQISLFEIGRCFNLEISELLLIDKDNCGRLIRIEWDDIILNLGLMTLGIK